MDGKGSADLAAIGRGQWEGAGGGCSAASGSKTRGRQRRGSHRKGRQGAQLRGPRGQCLQCALQPLSRTPRFRLPSRSSGACTTVMLARAFAEFGMVYTDSATTLCMSCCWDPSCSFAWLPHSSDTLCEGFQILVWLAAGSFVYLLMEGQREV